MIRCKGTTIFFNNQVTKLVIVILNIFIKIFKDILVKLRYTSYLCHMINYLEYDVIVIMRDDDDKIEEKRLLENMGMPIPEGDTEERKVKYSFTPSKLIGIRETFVKYQGNKLPGVIVELSVHPYETPVLLVEYKEFKGQLKEWNENNKKIT